MTIVILGLARQGKALARFFAAQGARVIVSDMRSAEQLQATLAELEDMTFPINSERRNAIQYVLGSHPLSLLDDCEMLCLSGGVPIDLPLVQEAVRRGIPLNNDAQEFLRRCPAPVIGITGSAGKTTTTALVGKMLKTAGFTTWVGGNIGNPLLTDLDAFSEGHAIRPQDWVVMELSSFQLEIMSPLLNGASFSDFKFANSKFIPCVLNITPNHLDRHKAMEAYIAAKRNIVAYQKPEDVAVLSYDEPNARALAAVTQARVHYFSGECEVPVGAFLREDALVLRRPQMVPGPVEIEVCRRSDVRLRGFHNVLNVLAAITLADVAGVPTPAMYEAIRSFTGVEHRLEEVCRWQGVLWVNDSISTAPERVLAALDAFEEPLILLAGGRDKDLPWELYAQRVVERVRVLITFGEAANLIEEHVRKRWSAEVGRHGSWGARDLERHVVDVSLPPCSSAGVALERIVPAETLDNAVRVAAESARPGDVVLLSPGGTSFDAFRDFAERGERFKIRVHELGVKSCELRFEYDVRVLNS
ncbi:MAG: UDP-N-acetylmuramoyl-L-alanine--D-glutamate ligase [Anaerolineae bacterium]|nr:UDP-N-acetylmuramoyl-L-alanine--D-glutamate ligase [Anaerolineae bacterium]